MNEIQRNASQLADEILALVDDADSMTRSDLQGCAEAIALKALTA